jgi:hypothetical protein
MNAQEFFHLAEKVVARRATPPERKALDALLEAHPELRPDFEEMKRAAGWRGDVPPPGPMPPRAGFEEDEPEVLEERLLREQMGPRPRSRWRTWRWWLRLAVVLGIGALLIWSDFKAPPRAVVQIAVVQGTNAPPVELFQDTSLLQTLWPDVTITTAGTSEELKNWEEDWPEAQSFSLVKIIYDRPGGELRVAGVHHGAHFHRAFDMEKGFPPALKEAHAFLHEQLR